jgi:flagellar basal-body rod modification protein FlgD
MTPSINASSSTSQTASTASASTASATPPVTENMFLQLLVAQLQNQDPMNPADSTQFVTQLAQFQQMEQTMNIGTDVSTMGTNVSSMLQDLNQIVGNTGSTSSTSSTTPTQG